MSRLHIPKSQRVDRSDAEGDERLLGFTTSRRVFTPLHRLPPLVATAPNVDASPSNIFAMTSASCTPWSKESGSVLRCDETTLKGSSVSHLLEGCRFEFVKKFSELAKATPALRIEGRREGEESSEQQSDTDARGTNLDDGHLSRKSKQHPQISATHHSFNQFRPRNALNTTLEWALEYTKERNAFISQTKEQRNLAERTLLNLWHPPNPTAEEAQRRYHSRVGDSLAHRIAEGRETRSVAFLDKIRGYLTCVDKLVKDDDEYKQHQARLAEEVRRRREAEEEAIRNPFGANGVFTRGLMSIADVHELKFSLKAQRLYDLALENRKRDCLMREQWVVNLEMSTFHLGTVMTYEEFIVVYRIFMRLTKGGAFLVAAEVPRNGWLFVDHLIKGLIVRKIDKNKSGKIHFPGLLKHLFPAMSIEELHEVIPKFEARYLQFIDKKILFYLDSIHPYRVDHFAAVFTIIDSEGRGRVSRDEFVYRMPIDQESREFEDEIRQYLAGVFDEHARRDINDKLELVGDLYMDLECLARGLSVKKYVA